MSSLSSQAANKKKDFCVYHESASHHKINIMPLFLQGLFTCNIISGLENRQCLYLSLFHETVGQHFESLPPPFSRN